MMQARHTKPPAPHQQPQQANSTTDLAHLERRLQDFQAENALLGRTLKDVQAERHAQASQLQACQAQVAQLQQQLQDSRTQCAAVQREVQELTLAAARRDEQLQLSLYTRKQLEAIVLDLESQLDQLAPLPSAPPLHLKPQPQSHSLPTAQNPQPPQQQPMQTASKQYATAVCKVSRIPQPGKDARPQAVVQSGEAIQTAQSTQISDVQQASKQDQQTGGPGKTAWQQPPVHASLDLRTGMSRLEQLYQSQLQWVQQECDHKVQALQQQHAAALSAAQAAAADALQALKQGAAQQVQEAEEGLQRQLEQQVRLVEQLEKRCASLETQVARACQQAASRRNAPQQAQNQGPKAEAALWREMLESVVVGPQPSSAGGSENTWGVAGLRSELFRVRNQLQEARVAQQHAHAAQDAVSTCAAVHQKAAADSQARLAKLRQELCAAVEQQHDLTAMTVQQQQQLSTLMSQLAAAEAAIKDLRTAVCVVREQLVEAQATTQAHVMTLALAHAQSSERPHDVELLLKENGGTVAIYIRVLEHACKEAEEREAALKRAVSEAQYLEQQARSLLASSRDDQMAMQRALLKQVQQVYTLEELRLSDVQELHQLACQNTA